jgi:hypothetical protein
MFQRNVYNVSQARDILCIVPVLGGAGKYMEAWDTLLHYRNGGKGNDTLFIFAGTTTEQP